MCNFRARLWRRSCCSPLRRPPRLGARPASPILSSGEDYMTRWMTPLLAGSVCLAVGAGAAALAGGHARFALDRLNALEAPPPDQAPPPADRAPPRGRARDNAAAALAGAYDSLTLAAATARGGEGDDAKDRARLLAAARDFYRPAHT